MKQDFENGKLRELTPQEVAAMWLYHAEYAAAGVGAIEFYKRLGRYEKRCVGDMLRDIVAAQQSTESVDPHTVGPDGYRINY